MGCILACFRPGGDDPKRGNLVADYPDCSKSTEQPVPKNQLASVFLCEENPEKGSPCLDDTVKDNIPRESETEFLLLSQAKFLIACGTISETPVELPKGHKGTSFQAEQKEPTFLESPSLLNASLKKYVLDKQTKQIPLSSLSVNGEEGFGLCKEGSCESTECGFVKRSLLPLLTIGSQVTDTYMNAKVVDFEAVKGCSTTQSLKGSGFTELSTPEINQPKQLLGSKESPYPTPLNWTDQLQTPGTIYTMCSKSLALIRGGIRSDHIYPETKPFGETSEWKASQDDSSQFDLYFDTSINTSEDLSHLSFKEQRATSPGDGRITNELLYCSLTPSISRREANLELEAPLTSGQQPKTPGNPTTLVPGLSQWQEPSPQRIETMSREALAQEKSKSSGNSYQDRPIIGAIATHQMEGEILQVPFKQWNGNGVPNSTSKYKEDQKVSWHATPFERRLEKALIEENLVPTVALQEWS